MRWDVTADGSSVGGSIDYISSDAQSTRSIIQSTPTSKILRAKTAYISISKNFMSDKMEMSRNDVINQSKMNQVGGNNRDGRPSPSSTRKGGARHNQLPPECPR